MPPTAGTVPIPQATGAAPTANPTSPRPPGMGALQGDNLEALLNRLDRHGQAFLDRLAPYRLYRWLGLCALLALLIIRMFLVEGFYIVIYVLFIFILNQFILFLQPKDRSSLVAAATSATDDGENTAAPLPTLDDDEFRPFVRRLPEFKFWYSSTYGTILAFCATFIKAFDVPVFWPVLVFYFIVLFALTMRRQWLDMKRLKYVPWDIGSKKVYRSDPKRVSVTRAAVAPEFAATGRTPGPVPTVNLAKKTPAK